MIQSQGPLVMIKTVSLLKCYGCGRVWMQPKLSRSQFEDTKRATFLINSSKARTKRIHQI
jgi:hypothetical protein